MCFPIQPGCGRLKDVQPQPETRFCSKCGTKDWARLYESTQRLQFCFMPLWQTGQVKRYFRCGTCGAVSPV